MNRTEYFKAYYQENKAKILDRVRERNYVVREAQKEEREEQRILQHRFFY